VRTQMSVFYFNDEMNQHILFYAVVFGLLGYIPGSLPFAIWITYLVKGVDVRDASSGHATTANTIRHAGFLPGAFVFMLDVTKGFAPTWLALRFDPVVWIVPLTAALAVVGHCWPVFAGFRGGMGLATANGGMMAAKPIAILIVYAVLGLQTLLLHHSARASVITGILFAPILWLVGLRGPVIWIGTAVGVVIAFRFVIDWDCKYRSLWWDRDKRQ